MHITLSQSTQLKRDKYCFTKFIRHLQFKWGVLVCINTGFEHWTPTRTVMMTSRWLFPFWEDLFCFQTFIPLAHTSDTCLVHNYKPRPYMASYTDLSLEAKLILPVELVQSINTCSKTIFILVRMFNSNLLKVFLPNSVHAQLWCWWLSAIYCYSDAIVWQRPHIQ